MHTTKTNSEGTPELDWSKISSWNSKGTPKLVRQFTSRSAMNIKLVHQLDVGAARRSSAEYEEQFKRIIKSRIEVQSLDKVVEPFRRGQQWSYAEMCKMIQHLHILILSSQPDYKPASWNRDGIELGNKLSANQLEDQLGRKPAEKPARTRSVLWRTERRTDWKAACLDWSRREDIQARTVKGRLSWTGRRYQARTTGVDVKISKLGQSKGEGLLDLSCLDWSRREDIQARTVKGRLSWTGRRYQAGTFPSRIISLRAGTEMESSWITSSVQTSSKISWEGNQLKNQLAQDQFCGELNGEQTGKMVKDKSAWEHLRTKSRIKLVKVKSAQRSEDDEDQLTRAN
ncbi:hypothetical protein F511_12645 [Dorcoceras hygrometricum]|uniref:Uncharacterized protein n=1 Tax=Dorcoceras hygrometricum TaxID=472368 RepID=A0A2Z7CGS0_9LAMI|nr:hypothetical protein F511_12645 [Dorcoceras hygrometricum]